MSETVFQGFPPRAEVTPLPNVFFSEVLPEIGSITEARVVLHIFFLLSRRKGYPRFVSLKELGNDPIILRGLSNSNENTDDWLKTGLDAAVEHGILLQVPVNSSGHSDHLYFINNQAEKDVITRIVEGTLKIPDMIVIKEEQRAAEQPSDIYSLYEQNIGLLTPILAEELQEAEHRYPAEWIKDAFKEALRSNVRNWRYVHGILKRWEREGKKDGRTFRNSRISQDPDKYIKGKYGHVVRR
jgi:DNA replication protein